MPEKGKELIRIDLDQFKLHMKIKRKIELSLHFDSPSRRFYFSVMAFVVNEMIWRGIAAGADDLVIANAAGDTVLTKKGSDAGAGDSCVVWSSPKILTGMTISTIDSGTLEVWIR